MTPLDRLLAKLSVGDCWDWTGAMSQGYGRFGNRDDPTRSQLAHRALWQLLVGPIADGIDLDHLCRNRRCANPDHMRPIARGDHQRQTMTRHHCKRGHRLTAATKNRGGCRKCDLARYHDRRNSD